MAEGQGPLVTLLVNKKRRHADTRRKNHGGMGCGPAAQPAGLLGAGSWALGAGRGGWAWGRRAEPGSLERTFRFGEECGEMRIETMYIPLTRESRVERTVESRVYIGTWLPLSPSISTGDAPVECPIAWFAAEYLLKPALDKLLQTPRQTPGE